jgi:cytochrome c-type biogenesis protein CcmH/NrfG
MADQTGDRWDAAQEGAELLRDGQADAAIAELERVVIADPDNEYAYFFLGSAHFEKGRFDKATKAYLEALRIAPGYLGALVSLGHALRMSNKLTQALKVGHQILARDPQDAEGLHLMGLTHYARGEASAAKRYLERFLDAKPEVEPAQEARGLLQLLAKHLGDGKDPDVS